MENMANMVSPFGAGKTNEPMYVNAYEKGSVMPYAANAPLPISTGPCGPRPWYTSPGSILVLFILLIIVLKGKLC